MHLATLHPTPPYNLNALLDVLGRFTYPTLDRVQDGAYWRALRIDDGLALIQVTQRDNQLDIHIMAQQGKIHQDRLLKKVSHILNLDSEGRHFFEIAAQHPTMAAIVLPGLPVFRSASVFEALTEVIIEQQIAWVTAQRAQRWLLEWANQRIDHHGSSFYAFPTPAQIAQADLETLKPLKITFKRMQLLIDLAQQVSEGHLPLEALSDPDTAYHELLKIKGIGHWTAAVTVARAWGQHRHVTHNDVALQAAVNHYFYRQTGRAAPEQVIDTFAPFGDFAGLAAHHTLLRWVLDRY